MVKKSFPFLTCCRFDQWKLFYDYESLNATLWKQSQIFSLNLLKNGIKDKKLCVYIFVENIITATEEMLEQVVNVQRQKNKLRFHSLGSLKNHFCQEVFKKTKHQRILSLVSNNTFRRLFSISLSSNSQLTLNQLEINEKLTVSTAVTSPLCCPPAAAAVWWWRRQRLQICSRSRS